jgi:hypothetical protein
MIAAALETAIAIAFRVIEAIGKRMGSDEFG